MAPAFGPALEQQLGYRLFERTGRGVVLTDAAQQLAPRLRAALADMALATQEAAELGGQPGGVVRVGLVQGELDMAVINRFTLAHHRGEERLCVLSSHVVGPAGAFAPGQTEIGFRQLAELPLVVASRPNVLRVALDQLSRQESLQLKVAAEADSLMTMKDLVREAGLFTILPHHVVADDVAAGRMAVVRLVRPELPRTLSLVPAVWH